MQTEHRCDCCRRNFNPANQPSQNERQKTLYQETMRLAGITKEMLIHEYFQLIERRRIPKNNEPQLPSTGVCTACEDDFIKLITISGLLLIDNPTTPETSLKALINGLLAKLPSHE